MKTNDVELIFQVSDWDFYHDDDNKYKVRIYGTTLDQKKIFVEVEDFTPYFYVEIPKTWMHHQIQSLVELVQAKVSQKYDDEIKDTLIKHDTILRHKFGNFTNYKKFRFLRLIFDNFEGFRAYERILGWKLYEPSLSRKAKKYKLYESNIEPMLRLMHIRKLKSSGWIKLKANKYELYPDGDEPSNNDINIYTRWTNLEYFESNDISKFIVASFDIECKSEDGSFPRPERDNDPVIQIGTTLNRYGEKECFYKYIVTLKGCSPIEGVDVESYETEKEVLLAWKRMLLKQNPDIITGYNIFGFDYRYLQARAKKLGIAAEFSKLGRIIDEESPFIEKHLQSAALGDNTLRYYGMHGRVQVDLLKVIQRDHKLGSYKLDAVASEFIRETVKKIRIFKNKNKSIIYTGNTYGLEVDRYITINYNDGLSNNAFNEGKKYKIKKLTKKDDYMIEVDGIIDDSIYEIMEDKDNKVFWCQAKDDVTPQDMFRLQDGTDDDRAIIAKYCIQDCILCNKLMEKLQIITNNVGMSNVTSVPLSYIFLRGQGIKAYSLISKKCREKDHLIPVRRKKWKPKEGEVNKFAKRYDDSEDSDDDDEGGYEGAVVLDPSPAGYYEQPIPVWDYTSLYPSSMIDVNISHECLVDDSNSEYDNLKGVKYVSITFFGKDGVAKTCKYAQKKIGILPEILQDLLKARKDTRAQIKLTNDQFKKQILDGLQLAYKITANSVYGYTGATTSAIYKRDIAASTTARGRKMLMKAITFAEKIMPLIINPILDNNYDLYYERINELFDTNSCCGVDMFPGCPPREDYDDRDSFVKELYNDFKELLKGKTIAPKCIYGDSVTKDTPILCRLNGKIFYRTIDDLPKSKPFENRDEKEYSLPDVGLKVWSDKGWTKIVNIIRHKTTKTIYRILTHTGIVDVTEDHSLLDMDGKKIKPSEVNVGDMLLHNNLPSSVSNSSTLVMDEGTVRFDIGDKMSAANMYLSASNMGYFVSMNLCDNKLEMTLTKTDKQNPNKIKKIVKIGTVEDYVYDLETSNHHFGAGVGRMIVHNTDSVFVNLNIADAKTGEKQKDKQCLNDSIKIGLLSEKLSKVIMPFPHNLEYEKTFWPFIIHSKKRYVGNKYEFDENKFTQNSMGIVLKRRDNAPICKVIVGGIVKKLLNERSPQKAVEFAIKEQKNMLSGKYPIEKFIVTKTLKSDYVDRTRIVHVVLADRIAKRDPGNKPQSNDRIPYVYIVKKGKIKLQGDRVEHPDYVIKNGIPIDYLFYITNQIMKPALQFLEHVVMNPEKIFRNLIVRESNRREGKKPITYYTSNNEELDGFELDDLPSIELKPKKEPVIKKKPKKKPKKKNLNIDNSFHNENSFHKDDNGGFVLEI